MWLIHPDGIVPTISDRQTIDSAIITATKNDSIGIVFEFVRKLRSFDCSMFLIPSKSDVNDHSAGKEH